MPREVPLLKVMLNRKPRKSVFRCYNGTSANGFRLLKDHFGEGVPVLKSVLGDHPAENRAFAVPSSVGRLLGCVLITTTPRPSLRHPSGKPLEGHV
jgi:hypothetical protein